MLNEGILQPDDAEADSVSYARMEAIMHESLRLLGVQAQIILDTASMTDAIERYAALAMQPNSEYTRRENATYAQWREAMGQKQTPQFSDWLTGIAIIHKTESYILEFDPEACALRGADIFNPRYDPTRIGKPLEEIDNVYDYDFAQLKRTAFALEGVDRARSLDAIFHKVTASAQSETEKQLALLRFLSKAAYHNSIQPMHDNGVMVNDPLCLLALNEMRCGHVAHVALDLYEAAGYRARLVLLGGHIITEVYYEGAWHYFDADTAQAGAAVLWDGAIPSVQALSEEPYALDRTGYCTEVSSEISAELVNNYYGAAYYFGSQHYMNDPPRFYIKTATDKESLNYLYGWNHYDTVEDASRRLYDFGVQYLPQQVYLEAVIPGEDGVAIWWREPADKNGDLAGYRVYVSGHSRGWSKLSFYGSEQAQAYWSKRKDYTPDEYEAVYAPLPQELGVYETTETGITLPLAPGQTYYITIGAYDAYTEAIGGARLRYSNELAIKPQIETGH